MWSHLVVARHPFPVLVYRDHGLALCVRDGAVMVPVARVVLRFAVASLETAGAISHARLVVWTAVDFIGWRLRPVPIIRQHIDSSPARGPCHQHHRISQVQIRGVRSLAGTICHGEASNRFDRS